MKWFRKHRSGFEPLERRLRSSRPEPGPEFLRSIAAKIEREAPEPAKAPAFRYRAVVAAAMTGVLLVVAAVMGGLSYASTASTHTAAAISHAFTSGDPHPGHPGGKDDRDGNNDNGTHGTNDQGWNDQHGYPGYGKDNPAHRQYIEFEFVCLRVPPRHPIIHITLRLPKVAADHLVANGLATKGPC